MTVFHIKSGFIIINSPANDNTRVLNSAKLVSIFTSLASRGRLLPDSGVDFNACVRTNFIGV